jgi:hypothetical protein
MRRFLITLAALGAVACNPAAFAQGRKEAHPSDVAKQHVEQVAAGRHTYVVTVTATIDREIRKLDERALSWGQEKMVGTATQQVGVATQTFMLEVAPR